MGEIFFIVDVKRKVLWGFFDEYFKNCFGKFNIVLFDNYFKNIGKNVFDWF